YHPRDYISQAGLSPVSAVQGRLHVIHRDGTDDWIDPDQGKILPGDYIDVRKTTYEDFKDVALFVAALVGTVAAVITAYAALDDD
ncbi:MAG TPA: hypothetical protein VLM37_11530, partial [Fibrobacteraceae bacterium]|nr:hypothetical protein [Fibrobacteraceae bacterium]